MNRASPGLAPQRTRALALANNVRHARADLKCQVADGQRDPGEVILAPPAEASRMALLELLLSQPGWGPVRCQRLLAQQQLRENKLIGELTDRQRHAVADRLQTSSHKYRYPRVREVVTDN